LRQHLLRAPNDIQALRLLATCYLAARGFDHAETLLRHALSVRADFDVARFDLARVLFARQQAELALAELAPLLAREPGHAAYRNMQAGCLALLGDDTGAEALHAGLAREFPGNAGIAINHGHALRTTGARAQAIAEYRRALALRPQTGEAWWSLANLKVTEALSGPDAPAMAALLAGPLPDVDRLHLEYALGRRHEEAGDAGRAFEHYARGGGDHATQSARAARRL
jgi:tetratricopeptide (TPR) repeat protein